MSTQKAAKTNTLDPETLALARCYRLLVAEWQKLQEGAVTPATEETASAGTIAGNGQRDEMSEMETQAN